MPSVLFCTIYIYSNENRSVDKIQNRILGYRRSLAFYYPVVVCVSFVRPTKSGCWTIKWVQHMGRSPLEITA